MATKTKRTSKKGTSLNSSLINATKAAIDTTVENSEKWQKLTKKLIKKSAPVRKAQINMVFDTATAVKNQVNSGKERIIDLVGFDTDVVEKAVKFAKKNPVSKKVIDVAEDIMENISENPVVKQVEKTTEDFKKMSTAKFNDVKEDVLEQAQKIMDKGEELVEDVLGSKKNKKQSKAKTTAKAKKVVKTVKTKATTARKKVVAKVATVKPAAKTVAAKKKAAPKTAAKKSVAKTVVAKKKTATKVAAKPVAKTKTATVAKKAPAKAKTVKPAVKAVVKEAKVVAKKVAPVKKEVKTSVKDDLKIIYGIGPKLETIFNSNGIKTYADLAKADKTKIETVLGQAGPLFKNTDTTDWKKQAEVGAADGTEALVKWVARYRTA